MKPSNNRESKRRREHPEAPQAADNSSSSSESSTDTEMGLVDVCTIRENTFVKIPRGLRGNL